MGHFIEAVREAADIVLFDAPPTLAVSDPTLLAARMDGVLFVVSHGETKRGAARQAMSVLGRARANMLGTVINKLDVTGRGYYGQYYYSYASIPGADEEGQDGKDIAGTTNDTSLQLSSPHDAESELSGATGGAVDAREKNK
jgi:Mrp family chromosome partitioning ATPase